MLLFSYVPVFADTVGSEGETVDYIPKITAQPTVVTCKKGETASLSLEAEAPEGSSLTYQWYEGEGDAATAIDGATEAIFTVSTDEVGEKTYYCIVTNTVNGNTYTVTSDSAKVSVKDGNLAVLTDLKIVAGNYSADHPEVYTDVLEGKFQAGKMEYEDLVVTDDGLKIYAGLTEEIRAEGNVYYTISYNGTAGTGRGDSGILSVASDGYTVPFQFNAPLLDTGKENLVTIQFGTKQNSQWDISETYQFHITFMRGLKTMTAAANGTSITIDPITPTGVNTFTDVFIGSIEKGISSIQLKVNPKNTKAVAYVGDTVFQSSSGAAEIALENYVSADGTYAEIPIRLEWTSTDNATQTRNYSLKLYFIDYTPEIKVQPKAVNCKKGETASLSLEAEAPEGSSLTYQWYEGEGDAATAIDGATEAIFTVSTDEVGEKTYYCIVTNTVNGNTYTVTSDSVKVSAYEWDAEPPRIVAQPNDITCKRGENITLSGDVVYPKAGAVILGWYENGTYIGNTDSTVYTPDTSVEGTKYYYFDVIWNYNNSSYHFFSDTVKVTVDDSWTGENYMPIILTQPQEVSCNQDDMAVLSVAVEEPTVGVLTYQWYNDSQGRPVDGATSATFMPSTEADGNASYCCYVTNTVEGKRYTVVSDAVWVKVSLTHILPLTIEKDFGSYSKKNLYTQDYQEYQTEYDANSVPDRLFLQFSSRHSSGIKYQLKVYHNTTDEFEGSEVVETAVVKGTLSWSSRKDNDVIYTREYYVDLKQSYDAGVHYFFCQVTAYAADDATIPEVSLLMGPVKLVFTETSIGFEGSGTEEDPYLIKNAEDLLKIRQLVAEGNSFAGVYFHMVNDITLPEDWSPIGCTKDGTSNIQKGANLNAFSGTIDAARDKDDLSKGSYTLTVPAGGLPLLGFVNGATVKNLNIYGSQIAGAGLVNNYTGVGLSGTAIVIDNVTLKSGTSTLKSGLITHYGGNGYAAASAGFVVTIRNCTIEEGVTIGYDKDESCIGSIAGNINGTIENCTSYANVYGRSYVGGILGSRDNAMSTCQVKNCAFGGSVLASDSCAGGIVGGGYGNSTAPNGARPTVISCTVTGTVEGKECVGGIFGGDLYVAQTWSNVVGSIRDNTFTGKVSGQQYVGAIIGYLDSLNRYDTISGNTYSADCGAKSGIGFLNYLDTSYEDPTKMEGTTVFNTANGVTDCPTVAGCAWKANHNRTDDPLGKDADALCKMIRAQGDLNGDGQITNADAAQLLAIVTAGENEDLSVADLNGDGLITNADVAQLLQMVTAA